MITIVAVVAIVGLVTLFLNNGSNSSVVTFAPLADTVDQSSSDGNTLAGEATLSPCTDSDASYGTNDIYYAGFATGINSSNGRSGTQPDYCAAQKNLVEQVCRNGAVYERKSTCFRACSAGACTK